MAQNAPSRTYNKQESDQNQPNLKLLSAAKRQQQFKRARWSSKDYLFVFMLTAAVGAVMFISLLISNQTTRIDNQLSAANNQISQLKSQNDKNKDQITQMTSMAALEKFAKKNGMTLNSDNVQNIK
ncbi:cell division protein FtsL [Oenococcus sicerae]|uniref:cell division protein FtsL n=1 Tax=Oenococcus sicerae TaxID=2203724 RepID=UPI0039ECD03C